MKISETLEDLSSLNSIATEVQSKLDLLNTKYTEKSNEVEDLREQVKLLSTEKDRINHQCQQKDNDILDLREELKQLRATSLDGTLDFSVIGPPKHGSSMMQV